jgi:1-acyl-sn-glycerol-3-phosphate acyltransferase
MFTPPIADTYQTLPRRVGWISRHAPSLAFYTRVVGVVVRAAWTTRQGYSDALWVEDSARFVRAAEATGLCFHVEGLRHYASLPGPCVVVANHMSTLETFTLPALLAAHRPVSFVVKESLLRYPIFRHVLCRTAPIAVSRQNPRHDLETILTQGVQRIHAGRSIVVFPQTTRAQGIDPAQFNSIGVKLARRAHVPVVPLAVDTRAWGTGGLIKDFGPISPHLPVRFAFGPPLTVSGNGRHEHAQVLEFIQTTLAGWGI